jgi:hypothetical protein
MMICKDRAFFLGEHASAPVRDAQAKDEGVEKIRTKLAKGGVKQLINNRGYKAPSPAPPHSRADVGGDNDRVDEKG